MKNVQGQGVGLFGVAHVDVEPRRRKSLCHGGVLGGVQHLLGPLESRLSWRVSHVRAPERGTRDRTPSTLEMNRPEPRASVPSPTAHTPSRQHPGPYVSLGDASIGSRPGAESGGPCSHLGVVTATKIPNVLLLLSPGPRHESDVVGRGLVPKANDNGESERRTSTTLSGRGQGRSSTDAALRLWSGRGSGCR